jgi:transposase
MKTFQYRIYPTKAQETILDKMLEECRWVYNKTLEVRKITYEQQGVSLGLYDTQKLLPEWKQQRSSLKLVHSQVLQNVQVRLDLAFKGFFRRVKAGEEPGFPRFKGDGRYDSFCYPQYGNGVRLDFEDLPITNMIQNSKLAKSIADVAWNQLAHFTAYKAADAGRLFLQVDPRNTSKKCSRCASLVDKDLSIRVHDCPHCGLVLDRDHNAAINILALGLQRISNQSVEAHVL